jgi:hypothetical protein
MSLAKRSFLDKFNGKIGIMTKNGALVPHLNKK